MALAQVTGSERLKHSLAAILGELENLYAQDLIGAVQINIALRDGNVRTLKAYDDGFRILLIAAAAIGQREAFDSADVTRDPDRWHMPGESTRLIVSTADFIERRLVRHFVSDLAAAANTRDALRDRGATFMRVHIKPHGELVMEGWRVLPDEQGDLPL